MTTESYIKETIANLRNELTHVWGAAFIFGGGAMSLLWVDNNSWWKWFWFGLGIFFFFVFLTSYLIKRDNLIKWTDDLRKRGKHGIYS